MPESEYGLHDRTRCAQRGKVEPHQQQGGNVFGQGAERGDGRGAPAGKKFRHGIHVRKQRQDVRTDAGKGRRGTRICLEQRQRQGELQDHRQAFDAYGNQRQGRRSARGKTGGTHPSGRQAFAELRHRGDERQPAQRRRAGILRGGAESHPFPREKGGGYRKGQFRVRDQRRSLHGETQSHGTRAHRRRNAHR